MTSPPPLHGRRIVLEPVSEQNVHELRRLDLLRTFQPRTAHSFRRARAGTVFGPAMIIRVAATGDAIGVVNNGQVDGVPDVLDLTVFVDPARSRPGYPLEAYALYARLLFANGAAKLQLGIYDFDRTGQRILRKLGFEPQARLRQHAYVAGFFRDVVVFGSGRSAYEPVGARLANLLGLQP